MSVKINNNINNLLPDRSLNNEGSFKDKMIWRSKFESLMRDVLSQSHIINKSADSTATPKAIGKNASNTKTTYGAANYYSSELPYALDKSPAFSKYADNETPGINNFAKNNVSTSNPDILLPTGKTTLIPVHNSNKYKVNTVTGEQNHARYIFAAGFNSSERSVRIMQYGSETTLMMRDYHGNYENNIFQLNKIVAKLRYFDISVSAIKYNGKILKL